VRSATICIGFVTIKDNYGERQPLDGSQANAHYDAIVQILGTALIRTLAGHASMGPGCNVCIAEALRSDRMEAALSKHERR
jgi:hypothetical protein